MQKRNVTLKHRFGPNPWIPERSVDICWMCKFRYSDSTELAWRLGVFWSESRSVGRSLGFLESLSHPNPYYRNSLGTWVGGLSYLVLRGSERCCAPAKVSDMDVQELIPDLVSRPEAPVKFYIRYKMGVSSVTQVPPFSLLVWGTPVRD
eukprot:764600-Hanusia_phi.AAC.1